MDYCGNNIYNDNQLITIFAGDVRLAPVNVGNNTYWKYEYSMKDHIGNTRVVFAAHSHGQPELLQQTSYYPFGMTLNQQSYYSQNATQNKYLYNSKELQDDQLAGNSLDWYDYGARFYDVQIARFHSVDLLAEDYSFQSPFVYAANNPTRYIDWMGMGPGDPPAGTTQIYFKFSGSFGPQLGFNFGDIISGTLRAANVVGETKVGLTISPEGKMGLLFEQDSKNVNYEMEGSIPVIGGKSKSGEYGTDEHPTFTVEKTETQKGLVKEIKAESEEKITLTKSTSYEVGLGINAILVGIGGSVGFEHVDDTKTEIKSDKQDDNHK